MDRDGKQLVYLTVSLPQFLDSPVHNTVLDLLSDWLSTCGR